MHNDNVVIDKTNIVTNHCGGFCCYLICHYTCDINCNSDNLYTNLLSLINY